MLIYMRSILNNCISNLKKAIAEQSALIAGLTRCGLLVQVDIGKKYHLHATCAEAVRSTQLTKSIPKSAQRQSVGTPASSVASSTEKMSHENNNQTGKKSVTSEFAYRWLKTLARMTSTKKKKKGREMEQKQESSSNLVFYAQSTGTVISGWRRRNRQPDLSLMAVPYDLVLNGRPVLRWPSASLPSCDAGLHDLWACQMQHHITVQS